MKPHIKFLGGEWRCKTRLVFIVGEMGWGKSPIDAYNDWVRKRGDKSK